MENTLFAMLPSLASSFYLGCLRTPMFHRLRHLNIGVIGLFLLAACQPKPSQVTHDNAAVEIKPVAENLVIPWDMDFAPDGRIFITERSGRR